MVQLEPGKARQEKTSPPMGWDFASLSSVDIEGTSGHILLPCRGSTLILYSQFWQSVTCLGTWVRPWDVQRMVVTFAVLAMCTSLGHTFLTGAPCLFMVSRE